MKQFIFGEVQRRVTTEEFQIALKAYLVGRLGQLLRGTVLDTRGLDRQLGEVEKKKGRMIDGIADGLLDRSDPQVSAKLQEIQGELLKLNTQKREIEKLAGGRLDPDVIATQLIARVKDLTGFLQSQEIEDQRKALFGFCKRIVADAQAREIIIETDLTGMAQENTQAGLPAGLCITNLPDQEAYLIAQPEMPFLTPLLRFAAA